jgi:hypothetical protein
MTIQVHPAIATKTALSIQRLPSKHVSRPSFEDVCAFAEWQRSRT